MLGWGKCLLLACAGALLLSPDAKAQGICTTGTDPYAGTLIYQCSYETEVAGEPVSADCREDPRAFPQDPARVTGCQVVAGTGGADVQRCENFSQEQYGWDSGWKTCRTMAWGNTGYSCRREYSDNGASGRWWKAHTLTTCDAKVGRNNAGVTSRCYEETEVAYPTSRFEDGCLTTVSTPLARVTCVHEPGVPLDTFFGSSSLSTPVGEYDTPSCKRELLTL